MVLEVDVNSQRLARTLFSHPGGFVLLMRDDSEDTNAVMRRLQEQIPPDALRVITPSTIPLPQFGGYTAPRRCVPPPGYRSMRPQRADGIC